MPCCSFRPAARYITFPKAMLSWLLSWLSPYSLYRRIRAGPELRRCRDVPLPAALASSRHLRFANDGGELIAERGEIGCRRMIRALEQKGPNPTDHRRLEPQTT